jgi:flavin reductase (DIM6/NTAB) family NADH-FMN oxidoreductase RutF
MAAIRTQSSVFRCMQESRKAALHILAAEQRELAQRFFTPTTVESGHMNGEAFRLSRRELPILASAPAYLECGVREIFDRTGDHAIVVLEVLEAVCQRRARPMTIAESPWQYGG